MNQTEILEICRAVILRDFGRLDDIPYELANTVANIYYRFLVFDVPSEPSAASASEIQRIRINFDFAKKMVAEIRDLSTRAHPTVVNAAAEVFISILKYRIDDAVNKSLIRL